VEKRTVIELKEYNTYLYNAENVVITDIFTTYIPTYISTPYLAIELMTSEYITAVNVTINFFQYNILIIYRDMA
jgi:hypothetical protein